jgi:hypothetical protein
MTVQRIAGVAVLALLAGVSRASAQAVRGFASAGYTSDLNEQRYPAFGGGVLVDLRQPWVSAGAQGDAFVSWPYFGGRAAVFGQGNVVPKGPVRPFVLAGVGFGEDSGPMLGAGVEVRPPNQRIGLRVAVEDYMRRYNAFGGPKTGHQVAVRVGILF